MVVAAWRGEVLLAASSPRRCDLTTLTTHVLSKVSLLHRIVSLRIACSSRTIERLPSEGFLAPGRNLAEAAPYAAASTATAATRLWNTMRWQFLPRA